jgi:tetratricopeptide (TPR) repeat protein
MGTTPILLSPCLYALLRRLLWKRSIGLAFLALAAVASPAQTAQRSTADFQALATQAEQASQQNRLDDAVGLYQKALALKPAWAEGWWSLGTIEYDRDNYAKAARAFEKLIALDAKNGTAHAMLGLCQYELGKDQPALQNFLSAERLGILKDESLRRVAVYHLGLLQLRLGNFSAGTETLVQLAKDGVRSNELNTALGLAALLVRPQEAPADGTDGSLVVERAGEAEVLLAAKDFEGSKAVYASLSTAYPGYPNLHFAFGRLLLETHDADQAVEEFQRELKRDPQNVNSMLEIAAVRYRTDSADGVKYAEEAVRLDPRRPFGHYLLGLLYLDTQNPAGAISELEVAKRAHPELAEIYLALGNAYARAGRKQEAAQARAVFKRLNSENAGQQTDDVYGGQPSGLVRGKIQAEPESKPPD